MLAVINGQDGRKNGHDAITSIADTIIHPSVQVEYTWTGKTNIPNVKKRKFNVFTNIHKMVHTVCRLADSSYTIVECKDDFIYTVLKYAQQRL